MGGGLHGPAATVPLRSQSPRGTSLPDRHAVPRRRAGHADHNRHAELVNLNEDLVSVPWLHSWVHAQADGLQIMAAGTGAPRITCVDTMAWIPGHALRHR